MLRRFWLQILILTIRRYFSFKFVLLYIYIYLLIKLYIRNVLFYFINLMMQILLLMVSAKRIAWHFPMLKKIKYISIS